MTRILQIGMSDNLGGIESFIINLYRNINKEKIQFDFIDFTENGICFKEEIEKNGGRIYKVTSRRKNIIKNKRELKNIIEKNNYKIIHIHLNTLSYITPILVGNKIKDIKIIVHSHSQWKGKNVKTLLLDKINRLRLKKKNIICLACSEVAGNWMFKNHNYSIVNNGIDLDKILNVTSSEVKKLKSEFGIEEKDLIIGHIGSFIEVKNHEFFINFVSEFKKVFPNFKVVLVGNGSRKEYIEKTIKENKLEQYFILTGVRNDINVFVNMFDLFIMPSFYEGFPIAIVEAVAGNNICYLSDNISKETNISDKRIRYFNLDDNLKKLIDKILNDLDNKKEVNISQLLINKGLSIKDTVDKVTNIYLDIKK